MSDNSGIDALKLGNVCVHKSGVRHGPDISCSVAELHHWQEQHPARDEEKPLASNSPQGVSSTKKPKIKRKPKKRTLTAFELTGQVQP